MFFADYIQLSKFSHCCKSSRAHNKFPNLGTQQRDWEPLGNLTLKASWIWLQSFHGPGETYSWWVQTKQNIQIIPPELKTLSFTFIFFHAIVTILKTPYNYDYFISNFKIQIMDGVCLLTRYLCYFSLSGKIIVGKKATASGLWEELSAGPWMRTPAKWLGKGHLLRALLLFPTRKSASASRRELGCRGPRTLCTVGAVQHCRMASVSLGVLRQWQAVLLFPECTRRRVALELPNMTDSPSSSTQWLESGIECFPYPSQENLEIKWGEVHTTGGPGPNSESRRNKVVQAQSEGSWAGQNHNVVVRRGQGLSCSAGLLSLHSSRN